MANRHADVADLIEEVTQDKAYADSIREKTAGRRLAKMLVCMRVAKDKTQEEVANVLDCPQSRISRMENGGDNSLKLTEVARYASALGLHMRVYFEDPKTPRAERVKGHVFMIKKLLDELADLAGDDSDLQQKISEFYGEVLFNFLLQFGESCQKLPGLIDVMDTVLQEECPASEASTETTPTDANHCEV